MLLKTMIDPSYTTTDQLYNPLNNFSQSELMEKFNLAFYEAQAVSKSDIMETFKDFTDIKSCQKPSSILIEEKNQDKLDDDFLIDYLISEDSAVSPTNCNDFDFNDFVQDFDENVRESFSDSTTAIEFDTETFTTESSMEHVKSPLRTNRQFSNFFVPPPVWTNSEKNSEVIHEAQPSRSRLPQKYLEKTEFEYIDFGEELSTGSIDIGDWTSEIQGLDEAEPEYSSPLPPVGTITKNNFDFNCYVRTIPMDDMGYLKQDLESKSEFGHLIGAGSSMDSETISNSFGKEQRSCHFEEQNHMVLPQSDALLNDDPLLSSSNNFYVKPIARTSGYDYDHDDDTKTTASSTHFQCKWEDCYQRCHSQTSLVTHIEKCHVEIKRGDEFTCYWEECPRKIKPFNARYKLLIHMRVHSGEKPNKCPFKGCIKAFSRLENLKIHQRSHTGERPYLCQFTGCSKCFSNSSDRAKHQRTHFDTKPYACQVAGCIKKYTDPSSLRKHVKNHTPEEQLQIKRKFIEDGNMPINPIAKKFLDPSRQKAIKIEPLITYNTENDHTYSNSTHFLPLAKHVSINVKQDLKNKIEKNKIRRTLY